MTYPWQPRPLPLPNRRAFSPMASSDITCNYCKEKGHMVEDCEKLKKKEKDAQIGKPTQKTVYPECGTCGKKKHLEERCWQGAGTHLKLNVIGLKTHRTIVCTPKHKNHKIRPHHLVLNQHRRRTTQKANFATTATQQAYIISPTKCQC